MPSVSFAACIFHCPTCSRDYETYQKFIHHLRGSKDGPSQCKGTVPELVYQDGAEPQQTRATEPPSVAADRPDVPAATEYRDPASDSNGHHANGALPALRPFENKRPIWLPSYFDVAFDWFRSSGFEGTENEWVQQMIFDHLGCMRLKLNMNIVAEESHAASR